MIDSGGPTLSNAQGRFRAKMDEVHFVLERLNDTHVERRWFFADQGLAEAYKIQYLRSHRLNLKTEALSIKPFPLTKSTKRL